MWPLKPKYARIEDQKDLPATAQPAEQKEESQDSGGKLGADIMKLKVQFDQFTELRKVINERFTRINEQVGELRGMIMDANRAMQDIEVKTVKAVDLVNAVQPDKLMVEVRKQDAKIEALKANLESNEAMMKSILDQLKEMRNHVTKFRGIEQIVALSEEVKKELMEIKKTEASLARHSDKVEGIFIESQKRFQDFEKITGRMNELDKRVGQVSEQSDQTKIKIPALATRKDVEDLMHKFNEFEKHTAGVIDMVAKQANDLPPNIDNRFKKLENSMNDAFSKKMRTAEKANKLISEIEKKVPEITKKLKLQEEEEVKIESAPKEEKTDKA